MGRLVKTTPAAQERQEEKRTVVGTGANGRLVKVESSASKPSAMPAQGSTSPMLRQQNPDTRTSYQKALDEAMMKRAAADRKNRERGRRSSSRSHAQEVREITGDRTKTDVGSLVKSAAAGYAADMVGAADTLLRLPSGLNYAASQERGEIEAAKKNIVMYEEKLKTAKSDEERAQIQRLLDRNKRIIEINSEYAGKKAENYRNLTKGSQETLQRTYQDLRSSAAENMQKANEGQNAVGQLLNNVAVAGMQMGADIAAGLGRATVPMATRVFGGSSQEAMEEGIQPDMTDAERLDMQNRALLYGAGSAGVSVLSEKLSNVAAPFKKAFGSGVLDKAINRAVAKMGNNAAGKIAMSFASEGFEEMFEDAVQPVLQSIYNGQSVGENYSELEISDMLYDGLVGGILGGLGGGVEVAANRFARFDNSLGESGRKAIRGTYQEGKDTAEHVKDFIPAYNAGVEGKANPNPTNETAYAGYVAGQNDAKAEARKKTFAQESERGSGLVYDEYVAREMNSTTADEINTVAKALGVRVRMADKVRGGTANGVIEGNEIRIAKDAQDPVMQVVGHEWTHRVQDLAPEQYTAFRSAIMENDDVAEAAKILHEQYNRMGVEISMEQAMDEAAANYAGEMIANTDVLNEFIRRHSEDRTLLEKLRDAIREIVGKLTGKAKQQAQTAEGLLQQAFEAAAQNSKNAATEGGVRYSIDPYFSENVREWYEEGQNAGERFTLGSTGDVLQGLGAIESDIYMNGDKISRILSDHPEMTIEEIEKIPELLEDPVLILKSKGRGASKANSRVVLYGTMKAQNGEPVMAVLDLRPSENGFVLDDMQKVNSAYTKKNPANFVAGSDVLYADKKRTVPLLRQFGLTITSRELLRNGSIGSISYENGVVKLDGVPLSEVTGENVGGDYSLKGTENAQELAALKRENETLRERVDYWKSQTRRSDGVRTDSKSVEKAAKELTRRYGAEIEGSEIAGDLANLYDYIARGGDESGELTYTEARSRADAIAQRIAESAIAKDDEVYRTYGELRKYLKDTKITLSSEDAAAITDYADFRRGLFGKVNLGKGGHTNVDQVYSELAENYPEFFSETRENNVSDQIARIADVANELYSVSEYNPFEGYMGQAVSAISNDIMERFFDLPQAKKTFADVQAEKLDAAKAAGRKAAADAKLAGQMAQGRADAVKLRHTQEALQKARAQQAEKLDALRNRYREKDATRREKQANRELRAKITRHAKDLSKKLLRPTDKRHIPEEMRSSVAAVLNSINQESAYTVDESGKHVYDGSGTPTQRTEAFRALQAQYKAILKNDEGGDMVIDPSLLGTDGSDGLLEQVISMKDKHLSELTREELGTLWKTIRAVEKSVSTAGKVLSKSKFETTTQMADSFKNDLRTRRKKLGNNTSISLETPYTFFAHYGETGKSIYRMLRDAQDHQEVMARDVAGKVQQVLGDELGEVGFKDIAGKAIHGNLKGALRDARGSAIGKWEAETHDITVANGGKLTLTTPQIMELYLLSKRKQALGHLLGGGVIQPEIKSAETGRTKVPRGTQQVFLTDGDIERITGMLTDEQKRVADGLQSLTATTLANYGNEASMKAYGYRKFTERNYWPIKSAREGVHSNLEKDSGNVRSIKNIGMAQQVQQNANNAVELHSAFDTFAEHASDMIDYAAWLTTMEDLNRFYNYQYRNDAGLKTGVNVKGLLDEKGGKGSQQYWQKLMGDIQNGISAKDFEPITGKMGKFVGKFKGAAVGANIRVVIQQPTAFFRAAAVLDPKDMAKGMAGGVTKGNGWEKAMQYSPTAMRKDVGSFDISSPYTLQERFYGKEGVTNKLNDLAGAAAGKADAVTWGKLWNACEWQVKREKPDVRAGSNEFYHAVNEVFTAMIDQTQVVDGILQRSNIMRGKSTLSQQATAFMGEPIMSLNVLMRSYDNFRYEENPAKRSKALKTLGRAATALVVTNVVNALAQSIVDGLRDDDRDKDYWEKFLSAFTGVEGDEESAREVIQNVVLNGNIGDNMNPIGQIPFAKDILSLAQGYDVSRPDMEVFADMIKAGQTFIKSIDGSGKKTRKEATLGLIAAASKMFGLPVSNIKRDLMATLRTIAQASGSLGFQYEVEKFSYNLSNSGNRGRFIGILYDALEQGDSATYEHVRRDLMEQMGLDGESIQSSLKNRYKKHLEADGGYTLPKKALNILGVRGKYAESEEKEAKFSAKDLDAGAFSRYEAQRTDTYRKAEEKATGSGAFQMLSDEGKDKALSYANTYAEETALASTASGKYEIATKWVQEAQEAQQKYRIDPGVFAACRAAASECKTLKDRDGKAIDKSRGMQIMEMLFRSGLNEQQRMAMYEYLGVPESIRHWNRARVDEQLKIARRKAT